MISNNGEVVFISTEFIISEVVFCKEAPLVFVLYFN